MYVHARTHTHKHICHAEELVSVAPKALVCAGSQQGRLPHTRTHARTHTMRRQDQSLSGHRESFWDPAALTDEPLGFCAQHPPQSATDTNKQGLFGMPLCYIEGMRYIVFTVLYHCLWKLTRAYLQMIPRRSLCQGGGFLRSCGTGCSSRREGSFPLPVHWSGSRQAPAAGRPNGRPARPCARRTLASLLAP